MSSNSGPPLTVIASTPATWNHLTMTLNNATRSQSIQTSKTHIHLISMSKKSSFHNRMQRAWTLAFAIDRKSIQHRRPKVNSQSWLKATRDRFQLKYIEINHFVRSICKCSEKQKQHMCRRRPNHEPNVYSQQITYYSYYIYVFLFLFGKSMCAVANKDMQSPIAFVHTEKRCSTIFYTTHWEICCCLRWQ